MAIPGRRVLVLYGSETGNSQEKAGEIDRLCQRLRFSTELEEMDDIKLNTLLLDFDLVVFVISTTGQGQFPRNALKFWKSLRRARLPPNCLASVRFTVFGLGDSSYKKFNWASRLLRSRLLRLGAVEAFERGEADERHDDGIDSIYQPWVKNLREYLLTSFPLPSFLEPIPDSQPLPPKYVLQIVSKAEKDMATQPNGNSSQESGPDEDTRMFLANREKNAALSHIEQPRSRLEQLDEDWDREIPNHNLGENARLNLQSASLTLHGARVDVLDKANILKDAPEKYLLHKSPPTPTPVDFPPPTSMPLPNSTWAKVADNKRVTPPDHWQDVRLLTLEIAAPVYNDAEVTAYPGDVVVLYPRNYPSDVQKLIDMMGWGEVADKPVEFRNRCAPKGFFVREGATLRDVLMNNVDFNAIPTRMFLEKLSAFTTHQDQKEKLLEFIKPSFSNEFYDFTSRPRRTILEVLAEFHSAKIPVGNVPDMFPAIRGREYSIANGGVHWNKEYIKNDKPGPTTVIEQSKGNEQGESPPPIILKQTGYMMYRVDLLVALVEYKTIIRKPRQGLCSRYVKHLPIGTSLQISTRRQVTPPCGPDAAHSPVIAIAAGTGIAPIRSIIHDRSLYPNAAETLLFFGCRNKAADFYFQDEWASTAHLTVVPAFSRDPKTEDKAALQREQILDERVGNTDYTPLRTMAGLPPVDTVSTGKLSYSYDQGKTYVQHMIRRHSQKVCELLAQGAIILLCGNSGRMPQSVRDALRDAAIMGGFCENAEEAEEALFGEKPGKKIIYWEETW